MQLLVALALLGTVLLPCSQGTLPLLDNVHSKFEYKFSFRAPHIMDSKGNIPSWNHGGSAIASEDYLRVCPSVRSHRGYAWTNASLEAKHWIIDVSLRITGRLKTGADGMGIWITEEPGTEGPVYGSYDRWKGVGLFLDSFDNDAKADNPKIQLVLNDGSMTYDHRSDGTPQQVGSCLKDFRNRPNPVKIRITFIRNILEVWVHDGVSVMEDDYELCIKVENDARLNYIPKEFFLGLSAATGGLSDDHDVDQFLTYSVQTSEEKAIKKMLENDTAFNEMVDKYNQMSGEFDQRRDTYLKEHPDVPAASDPRFSGSESMDWQKRMELDQAMMVVSDMQVALQKEIKTLSRKIDVLLQREVRAGASGGGGATAAVPSSLAGDLTQIRATENNILNQLSDLRAAVDRRPAAGGGGAGGGQGGIASEQLQPLYDVKNVVGQQSDQLTALSQQIQELSETKCPTPQLVGGVTCVSPWIFAMVIVGQTLVYVGYCMYTQAQERRAKKFF